MKQMRFSHQVTLSLLAALIIISCSISSSPILTVPPQPTDTQAIETQPEDTEIVQLTLTRVTQGQLLLVWNQVHCPAGFKPALRAGHCLSSAD
jgi:hypothetical protein